MTKEELVTTYLGLIHKIAQKFYGVPKHDLIQTGIIGLFKAYDNYIVNSTTKFSTYAHDYIYGQMYLLVQKSKSLKISRDKLKLYKLIEQTRYCLAQKLNKIPNNIELAAYLNQDIKTIEDVILSSQAIMSLDGATPTERSYYETISQPEPVSIDEHLDVINSLDTLNHSEREIIKARYFKDMTQSEVARKLNMTQVMVSRYEKKGIEKMRLYMTV